MRFGLLKSVAARGLLARNFSEMGSGPIKPATPPPAPAQPKPVPGLSSACVRSSTEKVGPGASATAEYKVPEYFLYDKASYFQAEVEMENYRLPQPSSKK